MSWEQPGPGGPDRSCTDATGSPPRGPLRPHLLGGTHGLTRYDAPPSLAPYVEWIWCVEWELPEPVRRPAPVLSHPCVHATLEGPSGVRHGQPLPAALIHGVVSRRFDVELAGTGWVVGLRFRPGGYTALCNEDTAPLTDRVARQESPAALAAVEQACAAPGREARVAALVGWWAAAVPGQVDATYTVVRALCDDVAGDRALTSVEALAERHGLSVRSVQRLIGRYVGVPPTWLIRRHRLQDALAILQADPTSDLTELATRLGWYDQAHFTRDFRGAVGVPPATYVRSVTDDALWRPPE